jgi:hypothetical protein
MKNVFKQSASYMAMLGGALFGPLSPNFSAPQELALTAKMSGPRATTPSKRCIAKTIRRINAGLSTSGSWRSWRRL